MAARRQQPPTADQVYKIADALPGELAGMWLLSCWTGLRVSEAAALRVQDVDVEARRIMVRNGKGGKPGVAVLLRPGTWIPAAHSQTFGQGRVAEPLFRNSRYGPWNRKSANKHFVKAMDKLGLPFVYHDSRKFFATYLLNHGASDLDVAVAMRHVDKHGRPNAALVHRVYGFVDLPAALDRVEAVVSDAR